MKFFSVVWIAVKITLILFFCVILYGCWLIFFPESETLKYRMTLVAADNGRRIEGSSVVQVSLARNGIDTPYVMGLKGEALVVDFGARGQLFALLQHDGLWELLPERKLGPLTAKRQVNSGIDGRDRLAIFKDVKRLSKGTLVDLPFSELPLLVYFHDINDPTSVERVDPENLASKFGPGIKLVKATIEITNAEVTTGIEVRFPSWFYEAALKGASLDGDTSLARRIPAPLANRLHIGYFKRGFDK